MTAKSTLWINENESGTLSGHFFEKGKTYYFRGVLHQGPDGPVFERQSLAVKRSGARKAWVPLRPPKGNDTWKRLEQAILLAQNDSSVKF